MCEHHFVCLFVCLSLCRMFLPIVHPLKAVYWQTLRNKMLHVAEAEKHKFSNTGKLNLLLDLRVKHSARNGESSTERSLLKKQNIRWVQQQPPDSRPSSQNQPLQHFSPPLLHPVFLPYTLLLIQQPTATATLCFRLFGTFLVSIHFGHLWFRGEKNYFQNFIIIRTLASLCDV